MDLTVVTTNDGKFAEFTEELNVRDLRLCRKSEAYPEIQADSLEDVVRFGMDWLRKRIEGNFVIDDSGIFIECLSGFPGVYSSFVFRTVGLDGILRLMSEERERRAQFRTVIGLSVEGKESIVTGSCSGTIASILSGTGGFGYDPLFVPDGQTDTFAQMELKEKNAISHRGEALRKLRKILEGHLKDQK